MAQQGRWILQPQGPQRFERRLSRIPRITEIPTGIPGPAARGMAGLLSPFAQARWWSDAQTFIRPQAGAISSLLKLAVKRLLCCRWLPIISNRTRIAEGIIVQGIGAIGFLLLEEIQIIMLRTLIPSHHAHVVTLRRSGHRARSPERFTSPLRMGWQQPILICIALFLGPKA